MDIDLSLQIIYEDDVILVCNKPAGLMVEPDRNGYANLQQQVKQYLKIKTGEKIPYAQHLHRLDRVTSGLVLFTKQKEYLKNLSEQFAQRVVSKKYKALTHNHPEELYGIIQNWHRKEKKKAFIVNEEMPFTEKVILSYEIKPYNQFYLWDIELHTGKYHQIRAQLSHIDCPIIGDSLYGSFYLYKENEIALQAYQLTIKHPVTTELMIFKAPICF